MKRGDRRAALELSVGTMIVIIFAVIMLIMGIFLIRSIMCGAIGLTGDINSKVEDEVNKLFGATGGEVQCIGSSGEAIKIAPGQTNIIYCGIRAPVQANYKIELMSYSGTYTSSEEIAKWIIGGVWEGAVPPGQDTPIKAIRLNIPENAAEDTIILDIQVSKDGTLISSQSLDFKVSRVGFVRTAMC